MQNVVGNDLLRVDKEEINCKWTKLTCRDLVIWSAA